MNLERFAALALGANPAGLNTDRVVASEEIFWAALDQVDTDLDLIGHAVEALGGSAILLGAIEGARQRLEAAVYLWNSAHGELFDPETVRKERTK